MPTERQPWASSDDPDGATPLEDEEREGLKPTWIATRSDLNNAEAANIAQALRARRWSRLSTTELLDDLCLRQLHLAMFGDVWRWAGTYRLSEKNIGVDPRHIAVKVRDLVSDAALWIQGTHMSVDEAGARFHRHLVAIHPFVNGNGRHARAATDLVLASVSVTPFTWGGEALLGDARDVRASYIAALRAADAGDYAPLLTFVRS
ncbi:MAG: mobile mystery protein B [Actinomycetales bacterium]|nr:mobile mystery protein B [Actinomycetales bacterium]